MHKKILSMSAILLGLVSLAGAYSGGTGTPEDPYQIATAQDLIDLGQNVDDYDKSFVMTADIDLADWVFDRAVIAPNTKRNSLPIFYGRRFSGRFDGQGHMIRNLCINDPERCFQGLFGLLSTGAEIANLGLDGVEVSGYVLVGGLVGDSRFGIISSSHCTGTVRGDKYVGALVGSSHGTISSSHSAGRVSGRRVVGGLVGKISGSISSSHSSSSVWGEEDNIGGLVGFMSGCDILSSYSTGTVSGNGGVGGLVGTLTKSSTISSSYSTSRVSGAFAVGGLAGENRESAVSASHSSGRVYGYANVGGLVGDINKSGTVSSSYSTGTVHATYYVGGLAGTLYDAATISSSYSTGTVSGGEGVGGLVGLTYDGIMSSAVWSGTISSSFWDVESSEQTQSQGGGIGLTTEKMQDRSAYIQADWDFTYHPVNNPDAVWWMPEYGTPRLWWQYGYAHRPSPINNASTGQPDLMLQWRPGVPGIEHDVYFGESEAIVADANAASQDVFLGRQPADKPSCALPSLEPGKTYYWRIDGVNDADPTKVWKGSIWRFTVTDFVTVKVLDDFESYDDHCNRIDYTWQDGAGHAGAEDIEGCDVAPYAGNGSGAMVGNTNPPFASHVMVRDASQSLPMYYDNASRPWFSEAERSWSVAQDWTIHNADALTLYFRGEVENTQDPLYIGIEDSHGGVGVMDHSRANAVLSTEAQVWHIRLSDLEASGVDISAITKIVIGVGNRDNPQSGGAGKLYIDDIQLTKAVL